MDRVDEAREWIVYADNDMDAAHQLATFMQPKMEIICYHCQQSAEKMLKAFLVYSNITPPRTHELGELVSMCEGVDSTFSELAGECIRLNDYASQPRYPFGMEITDYDMRTALIDCKRIGEFIRAKIIMDKQE